ncbi:MAG: glycosyltransferase family 4 protein [Candidatus Handelsmanbacteria bacterium]|nr:glycosyltransferase family 4 protein [Candidatus Handelsmanbacteria bacterium]
MDSICILSTVHLCFDVRMFQAEARTLARAGFAVTLIALEDPTPGDPGGIRILAQPRPRHRLQRMLSTLRVVRLARAQPAALYAFHDPELLPAALLLKLLTRRKLVYDVHEDVPAAIRSRTWLPRPLRPLAARLYRLLESLALPFLDGLTLADHAYQKYYRGRRTITALNYPLMTYADLYEEPGPDRRPTLVYAGSITALRGLYEMIELARRLRPDFPDLLLRLVGPVGSPEEKARAGELIARHDLGGHVEFTGLVSHLEVHRHILDADAGLALLHPDPNYLQSLPTKMFEYMMMGRPVVVSNFPMWAQIVAESGCGFAPDPLDLDEVEQALRRLLGNEGLRREMGRRGRAAVLEKYSWEREGERLVQFYRDLLNEGL